VLPSLALPPSLPPLERIVAWWRLAWLEVASCVWVTCQRSPTYVVHPLCAPAHALHAVAGRDAWALDVAVIDRAEACAVEEPGDVRHARNHGQPLGPRGVTGWSVRWVVQPDGVSVAEHAYCVPLIVPCGRRGSCAIVRRGHHADPTSSGRIESGGAPYRPASLVLRAVSRQRTVDGTKSLGRRAITSHDWSHPIRGGVCGRLLARVCCEGGKATNAVVILRRERLTIPRCVIWRGGHCT
jgi:hypothetical protein